MRVTKMQLPPLPLQLSLAASRPKVQILWTLAIDFPAGLPVQALSHLHWTGFDSEVWPL